MKRITFLLVFIGFTNFANAQGASASASQMVVMQLSNAMSVSFVSTNTNTGAAVSLPFSNLSHYTNGVASAPQQIKIQSNKAYNITVATNTPNFVYSGAVVPAPTMPVSGVLDIQVSANGTGGNVNSDFNGTYASLSNNPQSIVTGASYGNNSTLSVQYQAHPGMGYPSGTYAANVVYTASQP